MVPGTFCAMRYHCGLRVISYNVNVALKVLLGFEQEVGAEVFRWSRELRQEGNDAEHVLGKAEICVIGVWVLSRGFWRNNT